MTIPKRIVRGNDGISTVTAFNVNADSPVFVADQSHPHFQAILDGLERGDYNVFALFDVAGGMMKRLTSITDRVSYNGTEVLWDGDPVHSVISEQIQRALENGESNYEALAKFWEKLDSNPDAHSKAQAYDWLAAHEFKITPEGDVVGYKGVHSSADGNYTSWGTSKVAGKPSGFVDGVAQEPLSAITQRVGSVVTMPRSEVAHDPSQACKRGLHVATYNYAGSYGDTRLEVHVNPRDIVSVPTDGGGSKVRVCKYVVAGVATQDHSGGSPVLTPDTVTWKGDVGYKV